MEAGVGEATTFKQVILNTDFRHENCYGFDLSWSRLKVAKDFLKEDSINKQHLFNAKFSSVPLCDNAIDIVYTVHSIEPNGGNEKPILEELYRITKNYLLLFEPDYELVGAEGKARMERLGYIKNLFNTAKSLGYNIIKREPLAYCPNPLNLSSVIIIKKSDSKYETTRDIYQCPITKTELIDCNEIYFSPQARLMYPVISGIPCLLESQAVLGCKYDYSKT